MYSVAGEFFIYVQIHPKFRFIFLRFPFASTIKASLGSLSNIIAHERALHPSRSPSPHKPDDVERAMKKITSPILFYYNIQFLFIFGEKFSLLRPCLLSENRLGTSRACFLSYVSVYIFFRYVMGREREPTLIRAQKQTERK